MQLQYFNINPAGKIAVRSQKTLQFWAGCRTYYPERNREHFLSYTKAWPRMGHYRVYWHQRILQKINTWTSNMMNNDIRMMCGCLSSDHVYRRPSHPWLTAAAESRKKAHFNLTNNVLECWKCEYKGWFIKRDNVYLEIRNDRILGFEHFQRHLWVIPGGFVHSPTVHQGNKLQVVIGKKELGSQATTANHWSNFYFVLGDRPRFHNHLAPTQSSQATKRLWNKLWFRIFFGIFRQYSP